MHDPARLAEIDALFDTVLDAELEERERQLAAHADDPELVGEVRALLELDRRSGGELDTPTPLEIGRPARAGDRVGAYRLLEEIGRGGMGVVWLAERADGAFEQRVALKLLSTDTLPRHAIRRFERERQILAHLNHDGFARLLDGGVDADGCPFIAMEIVDGLPIGEHCDRHRLPVKDRIRLVVAAARTVQAAHQNLIVHCDLKPGNILVTAEGAVKLLDFGIAERLDPDVPEPGDGLRLHGLTPDYASPEALAGEPITTASDVYQLGLLLYELLCGRRARSSDARSLEELRRELSTPPLPPSQVIDAPGRDPDDTTIAAQRGTTPTRLRRQLAGDLDAIVGATIHVDPHQRYSSASDLAEDLERYLGGLPVVAHPLGWPARAARLARRHPVFFTLAALLVVLALGLVWQTGVAREQRDRAEAEARAARALAERTERVSDFLVSMLTVASLTDLTDNLTVVELLDQGRQRLRSELPDDSAARAELEEILGQVYDGLGRNDEALELLNGALARRRQTVDDPAELADSLVYLARVHLGLGHHERTKELLTEALEIQRRQHPESPSASVASTLSLLSYVHGMLGELEPTLALRRESLQLRLALYGADHLETAQGLNDLCFAYKDVGRYPEARELCTRALEIRRGHGDHSDACSSLLNLSQVELALGEQEDAERHSREAMDWLTANFPANHPRTARALITRGFVLLQGGDLDGAEASYRRSREIAERVFPAGHRQLAWLAVLESQLDLHRSELARAEVRVRNALEQLRETHDENQHLVLQGRIVLAEALAAQGRTEEARAELVDAERRLSAGRTDDELWLRQARELLASL